MMHFHSALQGERNYFEFDFFPITCTTDDDNNHIDKQTNKLVIIRALRGNDIPIVMITDLISLLLKCVIVFVWNRSLLPSAQTWFQMFFFFVFLFFHKLILQPHTKVSKVADLPT